MMADLSYLRSTLFYSAGFIAVTVFVLLIYALIKFKRSDNKNPQPNLKAELLWTLVPFIILLLIALPVIKAFYARYYVTSHSSINASKS